MNVSRGLFIMHTDCSWTYCRYSINYLVVPGDDYWLWLSITLVGLTLVRQALLDPSKPAQGMPEKVSANGGLNGCKWGLNGRLVRQPPAVLGFGCQSLNIWTFSPLTWSSSPVPHRPTHLFVWSISTAWEDNDTRRHSGCYGGYCRWLRVPCHNGATT